MANFEIMMSVAKLATSSLWDYPRNISNTYTPSCGLEGDPDPDNLGRCGSEWKVTTERYALDETGLSLHWPPMPKSICLPLTTIRVAGILTWNTWTTGSRSVVLGRTNPPAPRTRRSGFVWRA